MRLCRTLSVAGAMVLAFALTGLSAQAHAKRFLFEGTVQQCTATCLSFAFLTSPAQANGQGSQLSGFIDINDAAVASGVWTGGDITALGFSVLNPNIPLAGPSNPPTPVSDNPFNLDQTANGGGIVVANGQMITNPRGTFASATSAGTTDGARLTSGFVDLWLTQGLLANNGAVIKISIDQTCTNAAPDIPAPCFEVNIFEGLIFVSGGDVVAEPGISVNPASLNFGQAGVGDTVQRTLTVTSDGQVDLVIGDVAQADPLDPPFSISVDNCSNTTLASGTSCTVIAQFDPTAEGAAADSFDVPSNATASPVLTINTSGSASAVPEPDISVDPPSLAFGLVEIGMSASADVTVTNSGTDTLSVTDVAVDFADFTQVNDCGDLAVGEDCTVTVTFAPSAEGALAGTLSVSSNDPDTGVVDVALSGTGAEPVEPPPEPGSQTIQPPPFALADEGGGCFIATAAYGSYLHPQVRVLRTFRDEWLLGNAPGRAFVDWYYRLSPPLADFIARHEGARAVTRWALTPVAYAVQYPAAALLVLLIAPLGAGLRERASRRAAARG